MSIQGTNSSPYTNAYSSDSHNMKSLGTPHLPNIPALPMIVVMFHMFFFVLSLISFGYFWTYAVIFINVAFFILGIWAAHDQNSAQAVFWMFCIHVSGMLIDIIVLGLYFGTLQDAHGNGGNSVSQTYQFSAAMIIINLIFKPITTFVLIYIFWFRDGFGKVLSILKSAPNENAYSSLDEAERT